MAGEMAESCIFCKIVKKEIPAKIIGESADWISFHDAHPQAPVHVLVIPKKHVATVSDLDKNDSGLAGELVLEAARIARETQVSSQGYRLVMNCNEDGGQTVSHVHLHLLGGRRMKWPPG